MEPHTQFRTRTELADHMPRDNRRKPPSERVQKDANGKTPLVTMRLEPTDQLKLEQVRAECEERTGYATTAVDVIRALIRREHALRCKPLTPPDTLPPPAPLEPDRTRRKPGRKPKA